MITAVERVGEGLLDPILSRVMEAMTFFGVERVAEAEFDWTDPDLVWARIDLQAPSTGDFWMVAPRSGMVELTDVVWAGEIEPDDRLARSLLAEIVNAVAGLVLAEMPGATPVRMGLPESGQGTWAPSAGVERRHAFLLDDGTPLGVVVRAAA